MSPNDSRPPLPTLLDVERAISELRYAHARLDEQANPDRWARERYQSIERVMWWLELELGPLVAELGTPIAQQASLTQLPPIEGIRRVLLERIATERAPRRDFTPSDLGELRGSSIQENPPIEGRDFVRMPQPSSEPMYDSARLHELGEVTPEEGQAISAAHVDDDDDDDPRAGDYCPLCHRIHCSDADDERCEEEEAERAADDGAGR